MSPATTVPIATAIGTVKIRPAIPAGIDVVLDILNGSAREKSLP
jgi:hypothetical protein